MHFAYVSSIALRYSKSKSNLVNNFSGFVSLELPRPRLGMLHKSCRSLGLTRWRRPPCPQNLSWSSIRRMIRGQINPIRLFRLQSVLTYLSNTITVWRSTLQPYRISSWALSPELNTMDRPKRMDIDYSLSIIILLCLSSDECFLKHETYEKDFWSLLFCPVPYRIMLLSTSIHRQ